MSNIMDMSTVFRKASVQDADAIWNILKDAIQRRKEDGSNQWQDGYPNLDVVHLDINKGIGYVLLEADEVVGYTAILINDEPAYADIDGKWIHDGDFVVYHRVAISQHHLGKGLAKQLLSHIEEFAKQNQIGSIRADTNFDNAGMLSLFEKLGYQYCGEVHFRGSARKAYEKKL